MINEKMVQRQTKRHLQPQRNKKPNQQRYQTEKNEQG